MAYELDGKTFGTDEEGYITDINVWNPELAVLIAKHENIEMTDDAWEVINFLHKYYKNHQAHPGIRILTGAIRKKLGPEKGNSKYLYKLFPYGPARQACKIAGLPKPTSCI